MASANDFFMKVGRSTATTLASPGYTTGDTSINVASTTNWPADTGVTFAIDEVDSDGLRVSGTYNVFRGKVAGGTQIDEVTYVGGDTNRNYSAGATTRVYILVSSYRDNRFTDGILEEHKQDGTHGDVHATSIVSTGTIEATEFITTGAGGSQGWETGLPAPDTITYNGNRSYSLVFNGADHTDLVTPGMRIRTTRTVTAPIQCTDLESSSSQYWRDTTVSGMTFTDDFVAGAWVKVESLGSTMSIISRYNGTSGWDLQVVSDGRVQLLGYNSGSSNVKSALSYQSIPLNKWVHVTAQIDMSSATVTGGTANYIMIDGVDVPCQQGSGGTSPTALIQAGNLEVGGRNGGLQPFDGEIAQAFVSSAKITQANVRTLISQGLTASLISTHSIVSAYDFNGNANDLNTTNANNLTAQASAGYATDSPFSLGADLASGYTDGTTDFGVVMTSSFSTNTTLTVQVPEGCTIPTSGGVSAIYYSSLGSPYGFAADRGRWRVETAIGADSSQASATAGTWYNLGSIKLNVPLGAWRLGYEVICNPTNSSGGPDMYSTLSTANNTESDKFLSNRVMSSTANTSIAGLSARSKYTTLLSATDYFLNHKAQNNSTTTLQLSSAWGGTVFADCAYV